MTTPRSMLIAACIAALFGAAPAQADPGADAEGREVHRVGERYAGFAGSLANLQSLRTGLRHGSEITLTDRTGSVTFTPPTRPMGHGNVGHALDLASRELARAGIARPTPQQIEAAMMGGTVASPRGSIALPGVLALRSQGMGWGRIAHTIGVHPGHHAHFASIHAHAHPTGFHRGHEFRHTMFHVAPPRPSGITTALGSAPAAHDAQIKHAHPTGFHRGDEFRHTTFRVTPSHSSGITTALGRAPAAPGAQIRHGDSPSRPQVSTGAGARNPLSRPSLVRTG